LRRLGGVEGSVVIVHKGTIRVRVRCDEGTIKSHLGEPLLRV
jgi:hypothetical protein